jgi:phosphate-selective porin OprO/OprP
MLPDSVHVQAEETGDQNGHAAEAFPLKAFFQEGFCLSGGEDIPFSMCIGGLLQADYQAYDYPGEEDPPSDKFDIRRARLSISGKMTDLVKYRFEYEFEGAGSRRLMDAYGDMNIRNGGIRLGQFKEPYGLEQTSSDRDLFFAERSVGYYMTPGRDVGIMGWGSAWNNRFHYGVGVFNGNGYDDATSGEEDAPEITGRLSVNPLLEENPEWGRNLQAGISKSYAEIDRTDVNITLKTTGMTPFFQVASSAKFKIIQDADSRVRFGADIGFATGPAVFWGEYFSTTYNDVETGTDQFTIDLESAYGALLIMISGEQPGFHGGKMLPIRPRQSICEGGWGALGLGFRYDTFKTASSVYDELITPGNSVRKAEA